MGYGLGPASTAAFNVTTDKKSIAVMGDGGFWHNGLTTGIGNAVFNKHDGVIIVVDNYLLGGDRRPGHPVVARRQRSALDPASDRQGGRGHRRHLGAADRPHLRRRQDARHAEGGADDQDAGTEGHRRLVRMHAEQAAPREAAVQQGGRRAASAWCASASASTRTSAPAITPASACPAVRRCRSSTADDPLKDDPVAAIDNTCVGCGNCGEVAEAAVLCPSFYRADIIHNPTGFDRVHGAAARRGDRLPAAPPRAPARSLSPNGELDERRACQASALDTTKPLAIAVHGDGRPGRRRAGRLDRRAVREPKAGSRSRPRCPASRSAPARPSITSRLPLPPNAPRGRSPVLSLMPVPGEVDIVIGAELMEAGRAIQRGLVTPDRTTLIASSHRAYAVVEKQTPGDGIADPDTVLDRGRRPAAKRFIAFDMAALGRTKPAASSRRCCSARWPRPTSCPSRAGLSRRRSAPPASASNRACAPSPLGYDSRADKGQRRHRPTPAPDKDASRRRQATGQARLRRPGRRVPRPNFPAASPRHARGRPAARRRLPGRRLRPASISICVGMLALDKRIDGAAEAATRSRSAAAKYIAVAMAYDDVYRVADLKTRASRFERVRNEVGAAPDQLVYMTEFMHPRMDEVAGSMPAGARPLHRKRARACSSALDRIVNRGRRVRTGTIRWFLVLYVLAGLKRFRRGTLRHANEVAHRDAWLAPVKGRGAERLRSRRRDPQRPPPGQGLFRHPCARPVQVRQVMAGLGQARGPARRRRLGAPPARSRAQGRGRHRARRRAQDRRQLPTLSQITSEPTLEPPQTNKRLPGDEAVGRIGEEQHGAGDIVAAAEALHRNRCRETLLARIADRNDAVEHLGIADRPRRHDVDGDAGGRELERPGAHQTDDAGLGRTVGRARRPAPARRATTSARCGRRRAPSCPAARPG